VISVYGTTAKLKKKFLSINEPIYSLRPFNAQSIHAKGYTQPPPALANRTLHTPPG
jgi:hypothetical protein